MCFNVIYFRVNTRNFTLTDVVMEVFRKKYCSLANEAGKIGNAFSSYMFIFGCQYDKLVTEEMQFTSRDTAQV